MEKIKTIKTIEVRPGQILQEMTIHHKHPDCPSFIHFSRITGVEEDRGGGVDVLGFKAIRQGDTAIAVRIFAEGFTEDRQRALLKEVTDIDEWGAQTTRKIVENIPEGMVWSDKVAPHLRP